MIKKNILFFINTLSCGGAEKVLVDLVNKLEHEYDITVVSVLGGTYENRLSKSVKYRKIINCKCAYLQKILSKIIFKTPHYLFNLLFLNKRFDIEIAYLGGFSTNIIAHRSSKANKIAFVHTDVSQSGKYDNLYRNKQEALNVYNRFNTVCFVSEVAKSGFEKKYGKLSNSYIIHNVIDVDAIKAQAEKSIEHDYATKGLRMISVGRLSYEKGFDRLIRIAKKLEDEFDFELWILGEGSERQKLEALIEDEQVRSVKLLGYQQNPYSFVKKADLYVCSSHFEGYSTSVTEAVVLGVPVLTTDCAGMREILRDNIDGIIVDNNETELEAKIKELLCNNSLYHSIKVGAQEKSQFYSNEYALREYDELFSHCLKHSDD